MHKETRECPQEFQDRLAIFGQNPYGENIFKFAWGRTSFIRMGNIWRDKYGNERREYRDRCQNHEMQCWTLMRWKPPEFYGSSVTYYSQSWDPVSRLYIAGEFPWKGRYEPMQPFMSKELVDGNLVIEYMELNHFLIDRIVPMILAFQELSRAEQEAARQAAKEIERRREANELADKMYDNLPSYWGPVSFNLQGCRTSLLDRKMEAIQKVWNRLTVRGRRRPNFVRGFQVGNAPRVLLGSRR